MKIELEDISLVRPHANKAGRVLLPATAHFVWWIHYRRRFLFFRKPAAFDAVAARLKAGLRKALDLFYPLAGRLFVRDDELMELECSGEGVMFIRATTDIALQDLSYSDGDFQLPEVDLYGLAQTGGHALKWPWPSTAPLLFFQVTRFSCGGLCISITFNHQAMDGTGAWHFWKSWAEVCRSEAVSVPPTWEIQPIDVFSAPKVEIPPYLKLISKQSILAATFEDSAAYRTRCFVFKAETVTELKRNKAGFTTFQLLTAHLWEKITLARQLGDNAETRMFFAVNCRKRLSFGPAYGGQAVLVIATTPLAASLVGRDGAELVRDTIQDFTDEAARRFCQVVEMFAADETRSLGFDSKPNDLIVASSFHFPVYEDFGVASSFHFPVYEDFGFGKPVGMAIIPTYNDGRVYYFPGRERGSVAAYITLRKEAMERFSI